MQIDEKARIAAADAIWNEFLYHADTVACGDRFQTPDAAMARRISDIAIAAYLSALGEQKPVAWQGRDHQDDRWNFLRKCPGVGAWVETRPLYASPLPVRPITDEDVERAGEWRDPNSGFTYTAVELATLLEHRDSFIVSHGLWSEYVVSLDARAALEAAGGRG